MRLQCSTKHLPAGGRISKGIWDRVNHIILSKFSFSGNLLKLFRNYLQGDSMFRSALYSYIFSGIGCSVLGRFSFSLFINEISLMRWNILKYYYARIVQFWANKRCVDDVDLSQIDINNFMFDGILTIN